MKVITGSLKGVKLFTLKDSSITKPTSSKVKESIFSSLQFELQGKQILDLFSGSGQLGIEALSRGASFCVFVEKDKQAFNIIKKNIEKVKCESVSKLYFKDAFTFLKTSNYKFDFIFIDPPYDNCNEKKLFALLSNFMHKDTKIIFEVKKTKSFLLDNNYKIIKEKNFGKTRLYFIVSSDYEE